MTAVVRLSKKHLAKAAKGSIVNTYHLSPPLRGSGHQRRPHVFPPPNVEKEGIGDTEGGETALASSSCSSLREIVKKSLFVLVIFPLLVSCGKQADFRQRFDKASEREERGNYWRAIGDYRELLRGELATNNRINVLFRLGDSYRKVESYTLSEGAYSTVLRDYHEEIYQELALGRLVDCYREAGRYRDALQIYPRLIGVTQEDILLASVYFDLGKVWMRVRQKRKAKESFRQAIQKCRTVQREHAESDFASYANQIEDDVRQVMAMLY